LAEALDRAVGISVQSLHHLRSCVINYANREQRRGTPINDVIVAVGRLLMDAEDDALPKTDGRGTRDPELARQVRAWCAEAYSAKRREI
jgi:hypothetical protein